MPDVNAPAPAADPFAEVDAANIEDIFGEGSWGNETLTGANAEDRGDATNLVPGTPAPQQPSVGAEEGDGETGVQTPASPEPVAEPPAPAPAPAPAAEPPAPPAPPSPEALELESLKAQVAALTAAAEAAKAQPAAEPTPAQPTAEQQLQPVQFQMPDQLKAALLNEDADQFTAGVNHLVSGILTTIQNAVVPLRAEIEALKAGTAPAATPGTPAAPEAGGNDIEAQAAAAREQYFSAFSAHRAAEFQPIIAAVAAEMANQFPGHPWNDSYIAAMGARVTERAKAVAALMKASDNPAPPQMLPSGARSAVPGPGAGDISDEIEATLGF